MARTFNYCLAFVLLLSFVACTPTESETKTDETPAAATPDAPKDMISGTWVLNIAKSKYDPPALAPKSGTMKYELSADGTIKGTTDGVDSKGRKTHSEYTAQMDGPAVPTNGTVDGKPNPDVDATAWKRIDDHTYEVTQSLKGQTVYMFRTVIAEDGKSRSSTQTGKNSQGQSVNNEQIYEKQ